MESVRATLVKHWLLSIATEFPRGLNLLFPKIQGEALNVKQVPGCNSEDYAEALVQMFQEGFITFQSDSSEDDVHSELGVSRIVGRFLALARTAQKVQHGASAGPRNLVTSRRSAVTFQLSESGGKEWEKLAEPKWFDCFMQSGDETSGDVDLTSQNLTLLMALMGWFEGPDHERVKAQGIRLVLHSNFQLLYWKNLSSVYQASFFVTPQEAEHQKRPIWFAEWERSVRSWHKKPWDLSIWPSHPGSHS
jgi:hypothetical protein